MSCPKPPGPAKLIIGLFLKDQNLFDPLYQEFRNAFGPIEIMSHWFPFDFTSYYEKEMGRPLFRRMIAFNQLIDQIQLPDIKLKTNEIEASFMRDKHRQVNIDPGFVVAERFVLATGKNFSHRIYLNHGIYADLTLIYQKGKFQTLPWTYPDYQSNAMIQFLNRVRNNFLFRQQHP